MAETLPGSPTREPNNVSYDNDPTRPTRDSPVHRGPSRLDEPQRERSYPGSGGDPAESITITLDGDGSARSAGGSESYNDLKAQLDSERAKRSELERLAQQQLLQTQKAQIEGAYREVYQARESKIAEAARASAEYDHEKSARATADAAYLSSKLLVFEDGKNAAETQIKQQQQQQNPAADRERFLATQDPVNADLIRQTNGRFFDDPQFQAKAVATAQFLINAKGLKTTDPKYRAEMLKAMREDGYRSRESSRSRYSAPPSRPNATNNGIGYSYGDVVHLTPEEISIAKATLTPDVIGKNRDPLVVYAERKRELMREQGH
jgi:hypothetical protein